MSHSLTRGTRRRAFAVSAMVCAVALSACQTGTTTQDLSNYPEKPLTMTVPAAPGGGYDQLGRSVQQALMTSGLVEDNIQVFNNPGAGGMLGFNQFVQDEKGDPYQLLAFGVVLLGAQKTSDVTTRVENDATAIAQLSSSYLTIVVKEDSEITSINDLGDRLAADPKSISIAGSVAGSLEQILMGMFAQSVGADPTEINYVPYENASEQVTAILSGDADISVTGISETQAQLEDGSMRALVVTSPERVEGIDAPTFEEAGMSDDLVMANWRGLLAPPDITTAERDAIVDLITKMHDTAEWKQMLESNTWSDTFMVGDEFADFVQSESDRIGEAMAALDLIED